MKRRRACWEEPRAGRISRSESVKETIEWRRSEGLPVGRPRELDYDKIKKLRGEGKSWHRIAEIMKCSHMGAKLAIDRGRQ
jgi:hypothetical protein